MECNIKQESECCCCFNKEDLFNMLEPYNHEEKVEIYSTMIAECFQIELNSYIEECQRNLYLICKNCVFRLRDAIMLRSQVQFAYNRLQGECNEKNKHDTSTDVVETKENILELAKCYKIDEHVPIEYDNMRPNPSFDSKASSSNEKPLEVVVEEPNVNEMENLTRECFKKFQGDDFTCNICGKKLSTKRSFILHTLKHSDVKSHKCEICGKAFTRNSTLVRHKEIHLNLRKFSCKHCDKTFNVKHILLQHERIHTNQRNFSCTHCEKAFKSKRNLQRHERIHLNTKDFICDFCKRGFREKAHVKYHIMLHMGMRNIKCDLCDKRFVNKAFLTRHMLMHSDAKKFICNNCGTAYKNKHSLYTHILKYCKQNYDGMPKNITREAVSVYGFFG